MNRLFGLIVADVVCLAIFIVLAVGSSLAGPGGHELNLTIDTEPQTLDPISIVDTTSDGVANKLYNKLVRLQYDDKHELKPAPDLAESFTIEKDRIYTFKLRKNVHFHNGREMKADDVVYSLKRLMGPTSKRSELMNPFVKGSKEYCDYKGEETVHDDPNLGIRALDDYTVQIELDEPFAPFLMHLSVISCAVIPREAAENKDEPISRAPMGTGPFKLAPSDWMSNQELHLVRFDDYFKGKPKLAGIHFFIFKDHMLALKRFFAGELDASTIPNGWVAKAVKQAGAENSYEWPAARTNYLGFGMPNGEFKNKADLLPYGAPTESGKLLRQAMSLALDRDYLCKNLLEGRGTPAIGILPPGMPGCKEDRPQMKQDLPKARELLAKAGYPGGKGLPPVRLPIRSDLDTRMLAQAIAGDFAKIGVTVSPEAVEWNRFLEQVEQQPQPMFLLGWVADYPDPDNFLYVLFNSKQWGSPGNDTWYSNPTVDDLTEKARKISDMAERKKLYERAEDIILDEMPWIPTYHMISKVMLRKEVKGIRGNTTPLDTGTEFPQIDFKDVDVER